MLNGNAEVFNQRVLHRTGDARIKVNVGSAQEVSHDFPRVRFDDNIIKMLDANAIGKVWKGTASVGEEKANVRGAQEYARVDDAGDGAASVKRKLLDDCVAG
jgi:hypothetical protein